MRHCFLPYSRSYNVTAVAQKTGKPDSLPGGPANFKTLQEL